MLIMRRFGYICGCGEKHIQPLPKIKQSFCGILPEPNIQVKAESEEEARKLMKEKLISELRTGERDFIIWNKNL